MRFSPIFCHFVELLADNYLRNDTVIRFLDQKNQSLKLKSIAEGGQESCREADRQESIFNSRTIQEGMNNAFSGIVHAGMNRHEQA